MRLIGVILMIVAFPIMFFFIGAQDILSSADYTTMMQGFFCGDDEVYQLNTSSGYRPGLTYIDMQCINEAGTEREVTMNYFLLVGVAFCVPFLLGLWLTIRNLSSAITKMVSTNGIPASIRVNNQTIDLQDMINQAKSQQGVSSMGVRSGGGSGSTLTDKLRQLQEARDAGLLSQIEFDTQRRQIIRDFSED